MQKATSAKQKFAVLMLAALETYHASTASPSSPEVDANITSSLKIFMDSLDGYVGAKEAYEKEERERSDREAWQRGDTIQIGSLSIVPKRDFGPHPWIIDGKQVTHGWVVIENHCNALPGATWGRSRDEATMLLHLWVGADRDADRFWGLLRAMQYMTGKLRTI